MPEDPSASPEEKLLTFDATHPYEVLNTRGAKTKRVWVVFHGIGFLSRYFLRYFTGLDPEENYIVAPQAPSLYYLDQTYRHAGASWLTREHTARNMENLLNYLEELYKKESLENAPELVLMGYSQGVSVLCRWVAHRRKTCDRMILYAGRVPEELGAEDFRHLPAASRVEVLEGDSDPFLPPEGIHERKGRLTELFGSRLVFQQYRGGHELRKDLLKP
ncbi:MAG: esterase [Robiginitalea sp.]|nr:esterase [Robiginitalea sp.]